MFEVIQWGILFSVTILVTISLLAVVHLWTELKAMQKSTHTLTYIDPLQQKYGTKPNAEEEAAMNNDNLGNIAL